MKMIIHTIITILLTAFSIYGNTTNEIKPVVNSTNWPLLNSTFLGGSGQEGSIQYSEFIDAVSDAHGNVIIATITTSTDLPVDPGGYQCTTCSGTDIIIVKLKPDLTSILAMVKIGGNGEDIFPKIALGYNGRICVITQTTSTNFPTTSQAYSRIRRGPNDFVISIFDNTLSTLLVSSYFGGSGTEYFPDIDVNPEGEIYISGQVDYRSVPTTTGAPQRVYAGGTSDCFVSKFSQNLDTLKASTLIGGRYEDRAGEMELFSNGDVAIGVSTESDNYPTTTGAYNTSYHGTPAPGEYKHDCAVTRLNSSLTTIMASTFVGGTDFEGAYLLTLDKDDNVFIGGHSSSPEYPASPGAFDAEHNGVNEYFVTKLDENLTTLLASTFFTPNLASGPFCTNLFIDTTGLVYFAGAAWDPLFYTTPDAYDATFNGGTGDYCLMVLSNNLSNVLYSTFIGGTNFEIDAAIGSVHDSVVTIVGITRSSDFPTTPDALYPTFQNGASDITASRISIGQCCKGTRGNVDLSGIVDIGDLSMLAAYLTGFCSQIPCTNAANIDGEEIIDVSDLSALVEYLMGGGFTLPTCP